MFFSVWVPDRGTVLKGGSSLTNDLYAVDFASFVHAPRFLLIKPRGLFAVGVVLFMCESHLMRSFEISTPRYECESVFWRIE